MGWALLASILFSSSAKADPPLSPDTTPELENISEFFQGEEDVPPEIPKDYRPEDFLEYKLDPEEDLSKLRETLVSEVKRSSEKATIQTVNSRFVKLLVAGQQKSLHREISRIVDSLRVEGDPTQFDIFISSDPTPNAFARLSPDGAKKARLIINIGLLGYVKNEDELAAIIAHEMTHANPTMKRASKDMDKVFEAIQKSGYDERYILRHREEIRADIGALDRLIMAGYNPWAPYNYHSRLEKLAHNRLFRIGNWEVLEAMFSTHPSSSIRNAIAKGYIHNRQNEINLAEKLAGERRLNGSLRLLKARAATYSATAAVLRDLPKKTLTLAAALWAAHSYGYLDAFLGISGKDASQLLAHCLEFAATYPKSVLGALAGILPSLGIADNLHIKISEFYKYKKRMKESKEAMLLKNALAAQEKGATASAEILRDVLAGKEVSGNMLLHAAESNLDALTMADEIMDTAWYKRERDKLVEAAESSFEQYFGRHGESFASIPEKFTKLGEARALFLEQAKSGLNLVRSLAPKLSAEEIHRLSVVYDSFPTWALEDKALREAFGETISALKDRAANPEIKSALSKLLPEAGFNEAREARRKALMEYGKSGALRPGRLAPSAEARLTRVGAVKLAAKMPPQELLALLEKLEQEGFASSAAETFKAEYQRLFDYVSSKRASPTNEAERFRKLQYSLDLADSFGRAKPMFLHANKNLRATYGVQGRFEEAMGAAAEAQANRSIEDRAAQSVFLKEQDIPQNPYERKELLGVRYASRKHNEYMGMVEKRQDIATQGREEFLRHLRKFKTTEELIHFLETEMRVRNMDFESVENAISGIAVEKSRLQSLSDVEALLSSDIAWPKLKTDVRVGGLEYHLFQEMREMRKKFPKAWRNDPGQAEHIQKIILAKLRELGGYPTTESDKLKLWQKLANRAVTSLTDGLFEDLYKNARNPRTLEALREKAREGWIWDQHLSGLVARDDIRAEVERIAATQLPEKREAGLKKVVEKLQKQFPNGGDAYADILEEVSWKVESLPEEAELLAEAKAKPIGGAKEEGGLRALSGLLKSAQDQPPERQWELLRFLRGEPSAYFEEAFSVVGPERVRHVFWSLPLEARSVAIDSFLDSPRGLMPRGNPEAGALTGRILDHLLEQAKPGEREVARDVLEAFLYGIKKTNNGPMQSYLISYLLAQPVEGAAAGSILKNALERFGTTGVKFGQFLAASGILSEEETRNLRSLQERSLPPERGKIYQSLKEASGKSLRSLPFRVKGLKGSASLKWAYGVEDLKTGRETVLKELRQSAVAHTGLEFQMIDAMNEYLMRKNPARYSIMRTLGNAAIRAVKKELSLAGEVKRSNTARTGLYAQQSDEMAKVEAPREKLAHPRFIASEFAPGESIFALDPRTGKALFTPSQQAIAAEKILQMEGDNLFSGNDVIFFDPDRHAGNYRVSVSPENPAKMVVRPIDPGQFLAIDKAQRNRVFDFFAMSQVLREVGPTDYITSEIAKSLSLDANQQKLLKKALGNYFPGSSAAPETAYFSLLSALEDAGHVPADSFFDFFRSIVQLKQYEQLVQTPDFPLPTERFAREVEARAEAYAKGQKLNISLMEGIRYQARKLGAAPEAGGVDPGCASGYAGLAKIRPREH